MKKSIYEYAEEALPKLTTKPKPYRIILRGQILVLWHGICEFDSELEAREVFRSFLDVNNRFLISDWSNKNCVEVFGRKGLTRKEAKNFKDKVINHMVHLVTYSQ
jgi:hypothetical protein